MIVKTARIEYDSGITVLDRRGRSLSKLASVMPEVESFTSRIPRGDDDAYWIHVIALTASEYYGQNRNGDHWSYESLSSLPEGWSGNPDADRRLAMSITHGTPTFYKAHAFPHHVNKDPLLAIGTVELVLWNPRQYWVELVIRLDKAKTAKSKVKWVLDRIERNAPFDLSMGAKVPFDMATVGDMRSYREAWRSFDPGRHRSPADAILEYHRAKKEKDGIGIYGLSITRDDYIPECRSQMGEINPKGLRYGVRNDFPRFFDISVVFVGADKAAKSISVLQAKSEGGQLRPFVMTPLTQALDEAEGELKVASVKGGAIDKEVPPAFDEKSIRVLSGREADLPDHLLGWLRQYPDLGRVLSTLATLGIVLKPSEFATVMRDRELPQLDESLFDPMVASRLLASIRRRSALSPAISARVGSVTKYDPEPTFESPEERYGAYRQRLGSIMEEGPENVFSRNPDLWVTMLGRRGKVPLVGSLTRAYAKHAFLPPT